MSPEASKETAITFPEHGGVSLTEEEVQRALGHAVRLKRVKNLMITERGRQRVIAAAKVSNKERQDSYTGAIMDAAARAKNPIEPQS